MTHTPLCTHADHNAASAGGHLHWLDLRTDWNPTFTPNDVLIHGHAGRPDQSMSDYGKSGSQEKGEKSQITLGLRPGISSF